MLFSISLIANVLLAYYLYDNLRPVPSVIRFGFGEQNIVVYCETAKDVTATKVNFEECIYMIGDAKLQYKDDLYLISPEKRINLSQLGGEAFVINSQGELLYQLMKPDSDNIEAVFVTPSGKKYHSDSYCAGRTAFETDLETAALFGRTPCSICYDE